MRQNKVQANHLKNYFKAKERLHDLELEIGDDKVDLFKKNTGVWTGPIQDLSLFQVWMSLKKKANEAINTTDDYE